MTEQDQKKLTPATVRVFVVLEDRRGDITIPENRRVRFRKAWDTLETAEYDRAMGYPHDLFGDLQRHLRIVEAVVEI